MIALGVYMVLILEGGGGVVSILWVVDRAGWLEMNGCMKRFEE